MIVAQIQNGLNLLRNMGWRYTQFRITYELLRKTGFLKKKFPVTPAYKSYITLSQWKENKGQFFFKSKELLSFQRQPSEKMMDRFRDLKEGTFVFFNSTSFNIGANYDWITNPDTGFKYDAKKHWTEIPDYSKEAGDIKYVWEKSRFSYLYDLIRYDYHLNEDCSAFVFSEILSWIKANPVNCGPNYRCSQEISLRVLNWTFALNYYSNSPALTEEIFNEIQFAIYWQMDHIYQNINFSRIAVRNNHAITETLTLYLAGLLYPQFPGSAKWKQKGKAWFEEEIAYQVYEDGTFLQFSMNYHRVVIQLLTWAVVLSEKNGESFSTIIYDRAKSSVEFLRTCMVDENGYLPNYGANDGALFFRLDDSGYRDYRPQLDALATALKMNLSFGDKYEDINWYGLQNKPGTPWMPGKGIHQFKAGGYYIFREEDTLTFIRCGNHKDRPSQADNLHLDVWYKGKNILMDAGSYKYSTDEETIRYFVGTASHNTVALDDYDQMQKGSRFIWYNWSQCIEAKIDETAGEFSFKGTISAFKHAAPGIQHSREIIKIKGKPCWTINDTILNKPHSALMKQLWHLPLQHLPVSWKSNDKKDNPIIQEVQEGFVSELYGKKELCEVILFQTTNDVIFTEFEIKE